MSIAHAISSLLPTVRAYWEAGLTPLPRLGESPQPAYITAAGEVQPISWGPYKVQQPDWPTVAHWFTHGDSTTLGLVVLTGTPAYPKDPGEALLQILDVESADVYEAWYEDLSFAGHADILYRCLIERTPSGGAHVAFLCAAISDKSKLPLARRAADRKLLIELLQHQPCTIAPTTMQCKLEHPAGACYHVTQGSWTSLAVISRAQRQVLIEAARAYTEVPERIHRDRSEVVPGTGTRPGDRLNTEADADWWTDLLTTHGWRDVSRPGRRGAGVVYFQRPGKRGSGLSATYGKTGQCLYVFSSNAEPFEAETAYSPFGAYTFLEHAGNFQAAALALAKQYGMPLPVPTPPAPDDAPTEAGHALPAHILHHPDPRVRTKWQRIYRRSAILRARAAKGASR